jgi:hypothetical protein
MMMMITTFSVVVWNLEWNLPLPEKFSVTRMRMRMRMIEDD